MIGRGHGGRGLGFVADGEERPPQCEYDRRSCTGRGNELRQASAADGDEGEG